MPPAMGLQIHGWKNSPSWESLKDLVTDENLARGLYWMPLMESEFAWETGSVKHCVKRFGFMLTHANYLTVTASQGQTLRAGVTMDCARNEPETGRGTSDDEWWLNLYVMFSRVTTMEDMLLLRPPPRELLERGPPGSQCHLWACDAPGVGDLVYFALCMFLGLLVNTHTTHM